jgi:diguanylate cyclase (GGDEF)-like protein
MGLGNQIHNITGATLCYVGSDTDFGRRLSLAAMTCKLDFKKNRPENISPLPQTQYQIVIVDSDISPSCQEQLRELEYPETNLIVLALADVTPDNPQSFVTAGDVFSDIMIKKTGQKLLNQKVNFYAQHLALLKNTGAFSSQINCLHKQLHQVDSDLNTQEQVIEKIDQIGQLSRQINCLDLEKIATVCIIEIPKLISSRYASLYTYDQEKKLLRLLQHNHPYQISRLINLDEHNDSPMGVAIRQKGLLLIENFADMDQKATGAIHRQFSRNYHSDSCIIAPLLSGDKVLGILNLADKVEKDSFDRRRDLPPIQLLCEIIGSAMSNIELYEQVQKRAQTDSMTNLLNHRAFYDSLDKEVSRTRRYNTILSLIMMDLDCLKEVNDNYGHRAGDAVLIHVAQSICQCVRETDVAARYGGDEFAIILPNTSLADAMNVAERLVKVVAQSPVSIDGHELYASISVGLGQYQHGQSIEEFMTQTDGALFEAKESGKNRVKISD